MLQTLLLHRASLLLQPEESDSEADTERGMSRCQTPSLWSSCDRGQCTAGGHGEKDEPLSDREPLEQR